MLFSHAVNTVRKGGFHSNEDEHLERHITISEEKHKFDLYKSL